MGEGMDFAVFIFKKKGSLIEMRGQFYQNLGIFFNYLKQCWENSGTK